MKLLGSVFALLISLSLVGTADAYEVDQFTRRNEPIRDSTAIIDDEISKRIQFALETSNPNTFEKLIGVSNCGGSAAEHKISRSKLFTNLRDALATQNPVGLIEALAEKNKSVAKRRILLDESIYKTAAEKSLILKNFGIASVISVNNQKIGTDKLGHFLNEGYEFYYAAHTHGTADEKVKSVLRNNKFSENGFSGFVTTKVKSYADMAANYDGSRFWDKLCGRLSTEATAEEKYYFEKNKCLPNAYLKCENGNWALNAKQKFTLKDYVTPAWDESINCSEFHADVESLIKTEMSRLSYMNNRDPKSPCPAEPNECLKIRDLYPSKVLKQITHPLCQIAAGVKPKSDSVDKTKSKPARAQTIK